MLRNLTIVLCALSFSGCTPVTAPCPAFGTPLADQWSTALNVGDVVTYVSNTGSTVKLELSSREDTRAYVGTNTKGGDTVTCGSGSDRLYNIENGDVAMRVQFNLTHSENPLLDGVNSFTIRARPESLSLPDENIPGYTFTFRLSLQGRKLYYTNEFVEFNDSPTIIRAERLVEDVQVGDNIYPYGIELKYADVTPLSSAVTNPDSFAGIVRMILAEDAGLVQFELLNGEIYSRL